VAASVRQVPPFASFDQWAVASDGRIAVVSVEPYRVTFFDTLGRRTIGPILNVTRIAVDDALKQRWREEKKQPVPVLVFSGGRTTAQSRPPRYDEPAEWPDDLPAFLPGAVLFAPDGMLWVNRAVAAESPAMLDVIDRQGKVAYRVALPTQSRLVGFGSSSVYLVRIDEDDLQYLQRYRLP